MSQATMHLFLGHCLRKRRLHKGGERYALHARISLGLDPEPKTHNSGKSDCSFLKSLKVVFALLEPNPNILENMLFNYETLHN